MPGQRVSEIDWNQSPQSAYRRHRFLFFRCAVTRAGDLFKLSRPMKQKTLVRLTRIFRRMTPAVPMTDREPVRIFSVLDRLVPTVTVLRPDLLRQHSGWMDRALKNEDKALKLDGFPPSGGPEDDSEFLYLPSLKRCYTLVWRWLLLLVAGEKEPCFHPPSIEECNGILRILRDDFSLHSSTYLDLYPSWVEPREAGTLFERDRRSVRRVDPAKFRFRPWEGVPT